MRNTRSSRKSSKARSQTDWAHIARRTFRASASYEVVPFDRLTDAEQSAIAEYPRDPDFFGVLRPRKASDGTVKAISRNVALLVYALQSPGHIPRQAIADDDESIIAATWRLTLDGVLEVERDGAFVSGSAAMDPGRSVIPVGASSRLSHEALRFAGRLICDDVKETERRLYLYNRRPITARWAARLSSRENLLQFVGTNDAAPTASLLARRWSAQAGAPGDPWLSWRPRRETSGGAPNHRDVTYKLYLCPRLEELPVAFPLIVETLAQSMGGPPPFKIGATAAGMLRPDKIVAYFARRDAANAMADALTSALGPMTSQPVPFAHDLNEGGLVSLGIDPPSGGARSAHDRSWRRWICRRLAAYLHVARQSDPDIEADRFALERIALEGIDTATWEPSPEAVRGFAAGAPA